MVYGLVETRPGHPFCNMTRYVGFTHNLENRIRGYRRGKGNNFHHTNWLKVCPDFEVLVLAQTDDRDLACAMEIEWIAKLQTYKTPHGLNALPGGGGLPPGPRYEWRGRPKSAAHRVALSAAKKGVPQTIESNAKRSATQKGVPHSKEHNDAVRLGVLSSEVARAQISALAKGPRSEQWRKKMSEVASSKRWQCDECGWRSNAGGIGTHQKGSGHVGRSRVQDASPSGERASDLQVD